MLDAVRSRFPETNKFIDSTFKEEYEKERMTAKNLKAKNLPELKFLF